MQDCKFKQLIMDVYREWQKPERTFKKKVLGVELTYKNGEPAGILGIHITWDNILKK